MTINQYISDLRQLLKENGRDDNIYTDPFLYSLLNGARNTLIEQDSNKQNHLSEWDWYQFPIKLIKTKSHLVGCVTVGCDVLRSEYKLPRAITTNSKSHLIVTTFDYSTIDFGTEQTYQNNKYDDIKSNMAIASIINGYLVIWNNLKLKMVLVNGIWESILDWSIIPQCDSNGTYTVNSCFNARESEFHISETKKLAIYQMVLEKLNAPLRLKQDITNDSNSEIRI